MASRAAPPWTVVRLAAPVRRLEALYINLARRPARREAMEAQLSGAGVRWSRVAAVDGLALSLEDVRDVNRQARRDLRPSEIGCARSHRCAWRTAARSGADCVWVLEDDVRLSASVVACVHAVLDRLDAMDPDWHLIHVKPKSSVEAFYETCTPAHIEPELDCERRIEDRYIAPGLLVPGPQLGAYSYIASRSGASACARCLPTIVNPVDVELAMVRDRLRTYMWLTDLVRLDTTAASDTRI